MFKYSENCFLSMYAQHGHEHTTRSCCDGQSNIGPCRRHAQQLAHDGRVCVQRRHDDIQCHQRQHVAWLRKRQFEPSSGRQCEGRVGHGCGLHEQREEALSDSSMPLLNDAIFNLTSHHFSLVIMNIFLSVSICLNRWFRLYNKW